MKPLIYSVLVLAVVGCGRGAWTGEPWTIDSQADWEGAIQERAGLEVAAGRVEPIGQTATLRSVVKTFDQKRSAKRLVFEQSPVWQNWEPIENVGVGNMYDAPVLLSLGPDNYWMFARYHGKRGAEYWQAQGHDQPFVAEPATLEGFEDVPLLTTQYPNQFKAPGGLKKNFGGFNAWQSKDMVNWVHHGSVTNRHSAWVTTAEFADGKAYIYYDFPNDQDPHVWVDDDLFDGEPGQNMGLAFKDPTHGSDCAFIRDLDGNFHVIYEDWSHIHPNSNAFDAPVAGHAVSQTGLGDFTILEPVIDVRTTPTGEIGTYKHPHWTKEDPENFPSNVGTYEIHKPDQEAYGDWAAISIGGRYYLFGDYHTPPKGSPLSVAWFTADTIDGPFEFCDKLGEGHPDPDVCFAEGRFYLVTQQDIDYVSDGPWVESVETRVGVDTDGDGQIEQWTDWQPVQETYDYTPGFAKQITKTPATLDLTPLPPGHGFQFEVRLTDTTENKSKPILDQVRLEF